MCVHVCGEYVCAYMCDVRQKRGGRRKSGVLRETKRDYVQVGPNLVPLPCGLVVVETSPRTRFKKSVALNGGSVRNGESNTK